MGEIRAVLIDLGGTLTTSDSFMTAIHATVCRFTGLGGSPEDQDRAAQAIRHGRLAANRYFGLPFYLHRDLFRDVGEATLAALGAPTNAEALDRFDALVWESVSHACAVREGVHETLIALRQHGLHLGVVSNSDEAEMQELVRRCELVECFDFLLSSEAAGSCKPDPGIFAEALRRAGCAPEEVLFVGDMPAFDIKGANRAGMVSVLILDGLDLGVPAGETQPAHIIREIPEIIGVVEHHARHAARAV